LVFAFPPGGATDRTGRLLAGKLSEIWGQSVVVENKAGGSGMIGSEQVMRSPADGYTVLVTITTHIQNPAIFAKMPYDPLKDFEPISHILGERFARIHRQNFAA
jgi:tripartite-type tricarboxylate transporter receptor subunit TctC